MADLYREVAMATERDIVGLVTAYLEDTMKPEDREAFERHLETCDGCQGYIDQVRRVTALTGRPPAETLSREFQQHLAEVFSGPASPEDPSDSAT
jgi:anti-sigma factor RsiW